MYKIFIKIFPCFIVINLACSLHSMEQKKHETYFEKQQNLLKAKVDDLLHPILHGQGEKIKKGLLSESWETIKNTGENLKNLDLNGAYKCASQNESFWQTAKTVAGGLVNRFVGEKTERVLFHGGFYQSAALNECNTGADSLELLSNAKVEIGKKFPDWKPHEQCPKGIIHCGKIGINSKNILNSMYGFFNNINAYEKRTGHDFFPRAETDRIFNFLDRLVVRISEINLLQALGGQEIKTCSDDSILKPFLRVVNYLTAIPCEFHDVSEYRKKNQKEIIQLLNFLPDRQKRDLYDYMTKLEYRAKDLDYAHTPGDSSINLLFSGDSGTGKTFVGMELPRLLGFTPIVLCIEELRQGQHNSCNELEDLVEGEPLSGLETKLLRLKESGATNGMCPLNAVVFVDELDEDRTYSISELKEQFDQFKRLYFPSLGLSAPGFLNCIFTTNNKQLLKEPALISRFTEIIFPLMGADKKTAILQRRLNDKLRGHQFAKIRYKYSDDDFASYARKMVTYDSRINIRILIDNVDGILHYLDMKRRIEEGETYLLPSNNPDDLETFDEFLQRKFGTLNLDGFEHHEDSSSLEEENEISEASNALRDQHPSVQCSNKDKLYINHLLGIICLTLFGLVWGT